jgi:hypothetical protein
LVRAAREARTEQAIGASLVKARAQTVEAQALKVKGGGVRERERE